MYFLPLLLLVCIAQVANGLELVPRQIEVNVETQFTISLPEEEASASVSALLNSLADGSTIQCQVTTGEPGGEEGGRYRLSVVPASRGRHELVVTSNGLAVEGSPVKIFVGCAPQSLGRPVRVIEGVRRPAGVALCGETEMVVTQTEPAAVCVRDRQGKVVRSFDRELEDPYGVAVDSEGCVYVAELINCEVHKFSSDGSPLKAVGGESSDELAFPAGIAVGKEDRVYICDDTNKKVLVLNKNLDVLFSFGEGGEGPGQFHSPSDVTLDDDGNVFVADSKRRRIIKFSPDGRFCSEFEMKGRSSELELGICVGPRGHIFVSDFWDHCVVVFDAAGKFLTEFGKMGAEPGEFDTPAGIAVDGDGYVYVCDQMNSRIQVF